MRVVVCDAAHVTCKECPVLFYGIGKPGGTAEIVSSQDFYPGTFFTIKTKKENDHERKAAKNQRTRDR